MGISGHTDHPLIEAKSALDATVPVLGVAPGGKAEDLVKDPDKSESMEQLLQETARQALQVDRAVMLEVQRQVPALTGSPSPFGTLLRALGAYHEAAANVGKQALEAQGQSKQDHHTGGHTHDPLAEALARWQEIKQ